MVHSQPIYTHDASWNEAGELAFFADPNPMDSWFEKKERVPWSAWPMYQPADSISSDHQNVNGEGVTVRVYDSPFDEVDDALSTDEEKIKNYLDHFVAKHRESIVDNIKTRLTTLMNDLEEEMEDDLTQQPLSFESFKYFIQFLVKNPEFKTPSFIVNYDGNIRALWKKSDNKHLAAEFATDGTSSYVIFSPDPDYPAKVMRNSGSVSNKRLKDVVLSLNAHKWAYSDAG